MSSVTAWQAPFFCSFGRDGQRERFVSQGPHSGMLDADLENKQGLMHLY